MFRRQSNGTFMSEKNIIDECNQYLTRKKTYQNTSRNMRQKIVKYTPSNAADFLLNRMLSEKANGLIKKGVFTDEIVWGAYSYIIPRLTKKKQGNFKKGMFLFGMVKKDVNIYIKNNEVRLPNRYGQIEYSEDVEIEDDERITGTDLNHAYWRIAFNLGIISERTYTRGLPDVFKEVRLAALSTLGGSKKYNKIVKGVITDSLFIIEGDEDLKKVYTLIRYTCYKYMTDIKKKLGKDFLCYKTDCIYYIDTKQNRKLVYDFLEKKDLLMKQLE